MAGVRVVQFAKATGVGSQTVSGAGFRPKAALFISNRQTALGVVEGLYWSAGITDGILQHCRSVGYQDNATSPASAQIENPNALIEFSTLAGTPTVEARAVFGSWTGDGVVLNWTVNDGVPSLVTAMFFDCDAVSLVRVLETMPNVGDTQDVNVGFPVDCVLWVPSAMAAGDAAGYAVGTGAFGFGFSDCHAPSNVTSAMSYPQTGSPGPWHAQDNSHASLIPYTSSIFIHYTASLVLVVASLPTGFRLRRDASFGVTNYYAIGLAFKGFSAHVGVVQVPPPPGPVALTLPFAPDALLMQITGPAFSSVSGAPYSFGMWTPSFQGVTAIAGQIDTPPTKTARAVTAGNIVQLLQAEEPAASSTSPLRMSVASVDGAVVHFDVTATLGTAGNLAEVQYLALVGAAAGPDRCSDGQVPSVEDPVDGDTFEGLGPHEDRLFVEVDLDSGLESFALGDSINAPPSLASHPGRKAGRLLSVSSVIRRTTDRLGGWQASTARLTWDDHDRYLRGLIARSQWYNREFRIYLAKRTNVAGARPLGRFILREYPPTAELQVEAEGVDIVGSEFGSFRLDRDVLDSVVFDKARCPGAPKELVDQNPHKPLPIYMGVWSDESSQFTGALQWRAVAARGGLLLSAPDDRGSLSPGYGDNVSDATPPTVVTATALPGGSMDWTKPANAEYGFMVTAIDAAGRESNPFPFHDKQDFGGTRGRFPSWVPKATIDATNRSIRVDWSGATGAVKYRVYIGSYYYLGRYTYHVETTNTFAVFLQEEQDVNEFGPLINYYTAAARLGDGLTTQLKPEAAFVGTGPKRKTRLWIEPVAGAEEYLFFRRGTVGGWSLQWTVSPDQLENGFVYFDDVHDDATATVIDGLPLPEGVLPVVDIGDETLATGNTAINGSWGKFVVARWAFAKILGVFAGTTRLAKDNPNLLHPDSTFWPYPARTRPVGDCDATVLYLRGSLLSAQRDGSAVVKLNACTTEDHGDGTGATIRQAARAVQHLITELVFNDHKAGLWTGIPRFADGVPMIRTSTYVNAELVQVARVGGIGYEARIAIDQPMTLRDVIQRIVQSFGLHHGINRHGQVVCGHYDDVVDATRAYPLVTDAREIVGDVTISPRTNELENKIPYESGYLPTTSAFESTDGFVQDDAAIAANRGKIRLGAKRSLYYTNHAGTIADVMQRALLLGRYVRQWVEIPVAIPGTSIDVFDLVRVTDEAGIGANGYQEQTVLVLEHELVPPELSQDRALTVVLRGIDVTALSDAAWVWGPEALGPMWDNMTDEERGTFGAWATDLDKIPTDNSRAKEWR